MLLINNVFLAFEGVFFLIKGVPFHHRFDVASIKNNNSAHKGSNCAK